MVISGWVAPLPAIRRAGGFASHSFEKFAFFATKSFIYIRNIYANKPKKTLVWLKLPQGRWKILGKLSWCVGNHVIDERHIADFIEMILCSANKATIPSDAVALDKITQRSGVILLLGKELEKWAI